MDRREFITSSSRWFLAGGLVGITGWFAYRGKIGNPDDCFINPYCKRCAENTSCKIVAANIPDDYEKERRK
jgi:hypothetical protein